MTLLAILALATSVFGRAQPRLPVTEETLAGAWLGKTYHDILTMKLRLRADHRLEWSVDSPEMVNTRPVLGTWHVSDGRLAVVWELRKDTVYRPVVSVTRDTLILDFPEPKSVFRRVKSLVTPTSSNQAMQRTASKPATDVLRVCHPPFGCEPRFTGLAVADLVSR